MITSILVFFITLFLIKHFVLKPKNFPPGPIWIPYLGCGNVWRKTIAKNKGYLHNAFVELAQKYSDRKILGLKVGNEKIVIVGEWDLVHDVLCREEFKGRPDNFFLRLRCLGKKQGITGNDGSDWMSQRGFTVRHLRKLGFGTRHLDGKILNEAELLINRGAKHLQNNLQESFSQAVTNILFSLVSGERLEFGDPRLKEILDLIKERNVVFNMAGGVLNEMPWLRFILPNWTKYNLIVNLNSKMRNVFEGLVSEHEKTIQDGEIRDLIDAYLHEMKMDKPETHFFNREQLIMICIDLFIAGSQTTSLSLSLAFLVMLLRPDIQKKIQDELDSVVGRDRLPNFNDRAQLHYMDAFINEVNRYFSFIPIIGPRWVKEPTELGGYTIPERTTILISIYHINHDKEFWKDPEVFRPERFLDGKDQFKNDERKVNFGLGHRRCLGESLARACQYIFFSALIHRYHFEKSDQDTDLDMTTRPGILLTPKPYHPIITPRL